MSQQCGCDPADECGLYGYARLARGIRWSDIVEAMKADEERDD